MVVTQLYTDGQHVMHLRFASEEDRTLWNVGLGVIKQRAAQLCEGGAEPEREAVLVWIGMVREFRDRWGPIMVQLDVIKAVSNEESRLGIPEEEHVFLNRTVDQLHPSERGDANHGDHGGEDHGGEGENDQS